MADFSIGDIFSALATGNPYGGRQMRLAEAQQESESYNRTRSVSGYLAELDQRLSDMRFERKAKEKANERGEALWNKYVQPVLDGTDATTPAQAQAAADNTRSALATFSTPSPGVPSPLDPKYQLSQMQSLLGLLGGAPAADALGAVSLPPAPSGASKAGAAVAGVLGNPISKGVAPAVSALMGLRIPGVDDAIDTYSQAERDFMSQLIGTNGYDVLTGLLGGYGPRAGKAVRGALKEPVERGLQGLVDLSQMGGSLWELLNSQGGSAEDLRAQAIRAASENLYRDMVWDPVTRTMVRRK